MKTLQYVDVVEWLDEARCYIELHLANFLINVVKATCHYIVSFLLVRPYIL